MTPIGQYADGSRKKKVYDVFVQHGPDTAWTLGLHKLKLKENTLRSWFSTWRSVEPKAKAKAKVAAKPKAKAKAKGKVNATEAVAA